MGERPGERREPGQETVFAIVYHLSATARAALSALAAAAALFLLCFELTPAAGLLCFQLGRGAVFERLIVVHQVKAQAVNAVSGVDGGFDLGLAALEGVEEGDGDGGIVLSDAEAHLVKGVACGRVAVLGEVPDAFRFITGAVSDRVETEESPDLSVTVEAVVGTQGGEVGGGVHLAQAGDGDEVAGGRLRKERYETSTTVLDEGFGGGVLVEEALELLGEGGRDL
jgi:hypothetical protein